MDNTRTNIYGVHIMVEDTDQWKEDILNYIKDTYVPENISSGVELYSGSIDAPSFRHGFNTAKGLIIAYLEDIL